MAYAEHEFKLEERDSNGVSLREKLEHVEGTGRKVDALGGPALPESGAYLWGWFCEIHSARSGSGLGLNPISHLEIEAWSRLTNTIIRPEEVRVIRALDRTFLSTVKPPKEN